MAEDPDLILPKIELDEEFQQLLMLPGDERNLDIAIQEQNQFTAMHSAISNSTDQVMQQQTKQEEPFMVENFLNLLLDDPSITALDNIQSISETISQNVANFETSSIIQDVNKDNIPDMTATQVSSTTILNQTFTSIENNQNESTFLPTNYLNVIFDEQSHENTCVTDGGNSINSIITDDIPNESIVHNDMIPESKGPTVTSTPNHTIKNVRRKKGKAPKFTRVKKRQSTLNNAIKRSKNQATDLGYNSQYRVVDYMKIDNKICYKVEEQGNGMKTLTSQTVRKKCPINAIYLLESRIQFKNSLPFESIVKYGEYLKKYY